MPPFCESPANYYCAAFEEAPRDVANQTIHHSPEHPSKVVLPIMPQPIVP
jgi:hypothetical protein